jgi:hypothetical protein
LHLPLRPHKMGGVVNDGRPLCGVHISHHPFFKVLSCDLHLGDGEGGKETGGKTVKRSGDLKIGHPYSSSLNAFLSSCTPPGVILAKHA